MFQKVNNKKNCKRAETVARSTVPQNQLPFTDEGSNKNDFHYFQVQSEDVPTENPGTSTTQEILTFVDSSPGVVDDISFHENPIISAGLTTDTSLGTFLSRPTLIDTRVWNTSTTTGVLGSTIEPWYAYLNNSVILNKLKNYAFIRATLHVKIVINATPFHFGLMRVAYEPNVNAANTGSRTSKVRSNPTSSNPLVVPYSQLPGTWIYPADNAGGEIHVPFFFHGSWLPLTNSVAVKTMGTLVYYVASALQVASSSGSTALTIDTFAWLEDVELCGATNELSLQSKDEYDGIVSGPASKVASAAGWFKNIPVIGKFARATEIGASAVAGIAHIFGFTNVPVIDNVQGYVPLPNPHLSTSSIGIPVQKLTLDPKQELSIDATLHGISGEDEMIISNIIQKESALAIVNWSTSDTAGTVKFNADVSPMLFQSANILNTLSATVSYRVYHTPMSYLAMLFEHWRGDIIFELDVICTKFHKGRLKIAWDPLGSSGASELPENTVYTTILDIGVNNKASFRVPFHQIYEWQRCRSIDRLNWTSGTSLPSDSVFDNGLFIVSVLTPLMSPVSPQSVAIKVSVKAADNFCFANPSSNLGTSSTSTVYPSFFAVQGLDVVDTVAQEEELGDKGSDHPQKYGLNFGEQVLSLRALLHRFSLYDISFSTATTATRANLFSKSFTRLPPSFGFDPSGLSTANKVVAASGSAPFNFTPTHPITYVAGMYGAMRGSVNYISNFSQDLTPYLGDIRVQRITDSTYPSYRRGLITASTNSGSTNSAYAQFLLMSSGTNSFMTGGATFTNSQTNGSLSWNYPHMNGTAFMYTDPTYSIPGNSDDQSVRECVVMNVLQKQQVVNTSSDSMSVTTYAGTGPDFTCLWWLVCPTLDYCNATITAV